MKATVVIFVLSVINCTIYGAPAKAKNSATAKNAIEKSGLVSSRNRHGLSTGTKLFIVLCNFVTALYYCDMIQVLCI